MGVLKTTDYELSANVAGPEDSPRLALIHPGFLETWQYDHMRAYVKTLGRLGCRAIAYNAPGIWGSKVLKDSHYQGNPYQMQGYSAFRQVDAGREIIEQELEKNPDLKITTIGHSFGGMAAIYEAMLFRDHVDSVILDRAPYQWIRDSVRAERMKWEEAGSKIFYKPEPNRLKSIFKKYRKFEVNNEFTRYASVYDARPLVPLLPVEKLQIAGEWDERVLLSDVESDFAIAAEPKELVITSTDHYYLSPANILRNAQIAKKRFPLPLTVKPYGNKDVIQLHMSIVADWMERKHLLPK